MRDKRREFDTAISEEVIATFLRMDANQATPGHMELLVQWAEKSPEKLDQFEELASLWDYLGELEADPTLLQRAPQPWLQRVKTWCGNRLGEWRYPMAALAAALVVAVALALHGTFTGEVQAYATGRSEVRQVHLSDGSQLHLNGLTQLEVSYDKRQRHVQLKQGEAYFEVSKEAERAFVVAVHSADVRAVGTAFNIDKLKNRATVTVTEGIVDISLRDKLQDAIRVTAGEIAKLVWEYDENGDQQLAGITLGRVDKEHKPLAWRNGSVHLNGESLALALEKINRQSTRNIVIVDKRLQTLPVYGTFDINNIDGFLDALSYLHGIERIENSESIALRKSKTSQ